MPALDTTGTDRWANFGKDKSNRWEKLTKINLLDEPALKKKRSTRWAQFGYDRSIRWANCG